MNTVAAVDSTNVIQPHAPEPVKQPAKRPRLKRSEKVLLIVSSTLTAGGVVGLILVKTLKKSDNGIPDPPPPPEY